MVGKRLIRLCTLVCSDICTRRSNCSTTVKGMRLKLVMEAVMMCSDLVKGLE